MSVRQIDVNNDWTFGRGKNNYLRHNDAVAQNIKTRLQSFLGDCFFDSTAGLDWYNLLGSFNELALQLAVSAVILNTEEVTGIVSLSVTRTANRNIQLSYSVNSVYTGITNLDQTNGLITATYIVTQDGAILTTEDGDGIITE